MSNPVSPPGSQENGRQSLAKIKAKHRSTELETIREDVGQENMPPTPNLQNSIVGMSLAKPSARPTAVNHLVNVEAIQEEEASNQDKLSLSISLN